jgi:hypothetical protein
MSVKIIHKGKKITIKDMQSTPNVKSYFKEYFTRLLRKSPARPKVQKSNKRIPLRQYGEVLTCDEVIERMQELEQMNDKASQRAKGKKRVSVSAARTKKKIQKCPPPVLAISPRKDTRQPAVPVPRHSDTEEEEEDVCHICREPEDDDQEVWVGCDLCWRWFHFWCAGLSRRPIQSQKWVCPCCTEQQDNIADLYRL